jgi:hypothetical protein
MVDCVPVVPRADVRPRRLRPFQFGLAVTLGLAGMGLGAPSQAETTFFSIGTGGVTGVYYPTGGAICRLVNRGRAAHGLRCSVESTGGSIYNLNTLRAGELDFGIVQSDWQYHAYEGSAKFADQGPFEGLRAVFSVHPEPFTVVARADAGIEHIDDLLGKRVNIGNPGSGQRGTMEVLMEAKGWTRDDFALTTALKAAEQSRALCDNKIDAMVYTVGHPSGSISEATSACEAVLVDVTGEVVDSLVADRPYYRKATIPGELYRGTPEPTKTFGVAATVVTRSAVSEPVVYALVSAVFDNFARFRRLHPAFERLTPEAMVSEGLSAPLHSGAARYYQEQGWR